MADCSNSTEPVNENARAYVFGRLEPLSCYHMLLITFCQKLICSGWLLKRPLSGSVIHTEPLEPARPQPPYIPINGKKG